MLYDNHMHTSFSGDCDVPAEEMIMAAKEMGLSGVTITDHLDYDFPEEPNIFLLDLPDYVSKLEELSKRFTSDDFEVLKGIELGLQPACISRNEEVISSYDFDYCIGSTHLVFGEDPYYQSFWAGRDIQATGEVYFKSILQNITDCPKIDAVGHLDYAFRYAPVADRSELDDTYTAYADIVDEILKVIIRNDIALEVNTGSFRSKMNYPNPCPLTLKRYKELGGKLITLGADAHSTEWIGSHFKETVELLKECGFDRYHIYRKHAPYEIKI